MTELLATLCAALAVTVIFLWRSLYVSRETNRAMFDIIALLIEEEPYTDDFDETMDAMP